MYCGGCNAHVAATRKCPTCRAPLRVSHEENFKRVWKLVHDRSPGRHTPAAQYNLGTMYRKGDGVKQDYKEAVEWYRKAAEQGLANAQYNLGLMYAKGQGAPTDFAAALKWLQLAAERGHEPALEGLGILQQHNDIPTPPPGTNLIPTPPPGTAVTAILLTSAAGSKYNNNPGIVVTLTDGTVVKPGRVAVLLEGVATPISFKLMNLRV